MPDVPPSRAAPIIERAPLPIVEVQGKDHVVTHVNLAFCRLLGRSRDELIGQPFCDIAPDGHACRPLLDQVYKTGEATTLAVDDPDGPTAWLYAVWPALDADQRPEGVIIGLTRVDNLRRKLTDVNEALLISALREQESKEAAEELNTLLRVEVAERRRAEQQLHDANERLAETDRNKDEFLAMLAHELRNPLAPIKNAAQILHRAGSEDATIVRAQAIIERQADHLAKLVDDLLDLSRIQREKVRLDKVPVELGKAISRALDSCEHLIEGQHHTLTLDVPVGQPLYVEADPTRLDQILVNLISNAVKYTQSGGSILIQVAREAQTAVIRIRDNGIGIAPGNLRRVFELFTQVEQSLERSQGGLGLGLKLVKELVALHGGKVEARSEGLGKGSEFVVRLPALDLAGPAPITAETLPAVAPRPRRVLLVEDNPDARETMEMLLTMDGHLVALAEDGEQGVEKALHGGHDVAFVDLGLPKLSGYEVAKEVRRHPAGARLVLIALSGYGQAEDKRKSLEAGFDAHLTKPVRAATLQQILNGLEKFER